MSPSNRTALPLFGTTSNGGAPCLTLTYRQNPLATGLTLGVQTTLDLINWTAATNPTFSQIGTDSATGDPLIEVTVPSSRSREFIRLNITSH